MTSEQEAQKPTERIPSSDISKTDGSGANTSGEDACDENGKELNPSSFSLTKSWGPGFLVTAAFIGPGTVFASIRAGGNFGYQLLWSLFFAGFATIVFQGMAARLGLVTQKGLAESLADYFRNSRFRLVSLILVMTAIVVGNTAYQAGNLSGATKGLSLLFPVIPSQLWLFLCSATAVVLVWIGTLRFFKVLLMSMVMVMSCTFLIVAIQVKPSFPEIFAGCFSFEVFDIATVFALIGTTVVPYNLFLHSSTTAEQARKLELSISMETGESEPNESLRNQFLAGTKLDTWLAVWLGAAVTGAILVTASATSSSSYEELASALGASLGGVGRTLFLLGLFSAGLTSAITAPLAAGYVFAGCFGAETSAGSKEVRIVAASIVGIGYLVAAIFGATPGQVIFVAQVANGLILPLIALYLLGVMNSKSLLGDYRNNWQQNVLGGLVVLFVVALGLVKLGGLFGYSF